MLVNVFFLVFFAFLLASLRFETRRWKICPAVYEGRTDLDG